MNWITFATLSLICIDYKSEGRVLHKELQVNLHICFTEDSSGFSSSCTSEISHPSHRAIHKFVPRHSDEILLEVGDPVHVEYDGDDHWCQGVFSS